MSAAVDRDGYRDSLAGLVPAGRQLLVSCFDAHHTIGGGLFAVGDTVRELDRVSSSGMDTADGLLYRCLWSAEGSPAELLVYDERGILRYHRLDDVATPHDILAVDGQVLVAATTQNEVRCVAADGSAAWRWRAPGETDSWHLNSLVRYGDRVGICGFGGYLRRRGWDENGKPATGRVVALDTGEPLLEGLRAPHNPWYADGSWLICDSAAGEIVDIDDTDGRVRRRLSLPGWPRGLAVTDEYIFVGLSPHRHAASSVESAAVCAVDREEWRVVALADLPAREVYALSLVPDALAEGAGTGFTANSTRVHEQGQRRLFEQVGRSPLRLWAIGDPLPDAGRHAALSVPGGAPREAETDSLLTLDCLVRNTGAELLTPAPPHPVRVVHRWYDADGTQVTTQNIRAALPRSLPPQEAAGVPVHARVPSAPGTYRLRITLAQDGGAPFDADDPASGLDVRVEVAAALPHSAALAPFALDAGEVRAARRAGPVVDDMVRALFTTAAGGWDALRLARVDALGRPALAAALGGVLDGTPAVLSHTLETVLPHADDVLLTGAEAVALALHAAGVRAVFTGADSSALDAALARVGLLTPAGDARDALLRAGGAGRLGPGRGAAVLHGGADVAGALPVLAGLRADGAAVLVVAALPAGFDGPGVPVGAADGVVPFAGGPAGTWHGTVPLPPEAESDARRAAAGDFVAALGAALREVREAPHEPVLLAAFDDALTAAWVPLPLLTAALTGLPGSADAVEAGTAKEAGEVGAGVTVQSTAPAAPDDGRDPNTPDTTDTSDAAAPPPASAADSAPAPDRVRAAVAEAVARHGGRVVVLDDGEVLGAAPAGLPPDAVVSGGHRVTGGVAHALGAAAGDPSLAVLGCVGEAEFAAGLGALVPAVRDRVAVTFLVHTRAAGAPGADAHDGEGLERVSYARAAGALGAWSRRIDLGDPLDPGNTTRLDALADVLTEALGRPGPAVVEVVAPDDGGPWPAADAAAPAGTRAGTGTGQAEAPAPFMAGASHA